MLIALIAYFLGLFFYKTAATVIAPFNIKARKWIKSQWRLLRKIRAAIDSCDGKQKIMWMHCSSLGEFEQGMPIIEAFKERYPDYKILLTFFSPSGYEVRKSYDKADWVFYLPLDFFYNAKRFVKIVNPQIAIFVKYELWYHYLNALKKNGAKAYLISAFFRPKQAFFRTYGGFSRRMLRLFNHLFVQDQRSVDLLQSIGVTNVTIAGDTRFDRVHQLISQAACIPAIERFKTSKPLLVAGSTWASDEDMLAKYFDKHSDIQMVIAPHEVNEAHISIIVKQFANKKLIRYTQLNGSEKLSEYDILVIDTIGLLMSAYRYGDWAYIGGGFILSGIHNTLEAATFGLPTVFGPRYHDFMEAEGLINAKGAFTFSTQEQLDTILDRMRTDEVFRKQAGKNSRLYVEQNLGATATIINSIMVD